MSGHTPENPPAFPQRQFDSFGHGEDQAGPEGMTLRDWFAGQAFPVVWQLNLEIVAKCSNGDGFLAACARDAFEAADAMLAARATSPESPAR